MRMKCFFGFLFSVLLQVPLGAAELFFKDEPIQDGLPVFELSGTFADIYKKLDDVNWAGKSLNIAIESLENLNKDAHIAATDDRVVLVWKDSVVGNYPRPEINDWNGYGEITTALILKMRENDPNLKKMSKNELYAHVVNVLVRGIDENGRYVFDPQAEINEDGRILTSLGLEGFRDEYGNFRVRNIYKASPADVAGISAGDLIVQINGTDVSAMSDRDLSNVLIGFNSGTAKMKLLTPFGEKAVVLRRATVVSADADIIYRDDDAWGGLLEIVVHKLSDGAVNIVNEALARYPNVSGIILDLRATTGDDERAAAKFAGMFVGAVPVMRIVETAKDELEVVPATDAITDKPLLVLMSDMTRGTAEALVSAIYENHRGVLVGTPTAGSARIASQINLNNGAKLILLNKSIKSGLGKKIDGRGIFPIVCLSNIRTNQQQNAFFLNVVNNDFQARDFNQEPNVKADDIRRGCPVITSGADEDALAMAVAVKILTDKKVYNGLIY
ncbi:MAG: PDZ domain-containing protein [Alphaproteobacteria bacterium]|nr:PDZ domain-containing protein [Alphaproteobacteria bacterium]